MYRIKNKSIRSISLPKVTPPQCFAALFPQSSKRPPCEASSVLRAEQSAGPERSASADRFGAWRLCLVVGWNDFNRFFSYPRRSKQLLVPQNP